MNNLLHRPQRLRQSSALRDLVRETRLCADTLVMPCFVVEGKNVKLPIPSLPGQWRFSADELVREVGEAAADGVRAVILFGVPERKDARASGAYDPDGVVQRAVKTLKDAFPALTVITDVCLCEYTDHGHCGVLTHASAERQVIDNDRTLVLLAKTALSHAQAGADIVAPSAMMDGQVRAIRSALDGDGFSRVPVLAYSVKYASAFYGPFREAAGSAPGFGDRSSYQMDPANLREALREAELDCAEGADLLMVKPALGYLDVLRQVADSCRLPVAAYNVSGEYAMVKAAAAAGWIDEKRAVLEILSGISRAGAALTITYHARDATRWLAERSAR